MTQGRYKEIKRFSNLFCNVEKGFTLVEMLIVISVLGALASVVVPNVTAFTTAGNIAGANIEAANVKTAALSYLAEYGRFPDDSSLLTPYLSGTPNGSYTFNPGNGLIATATANTSGITAGLSFNVDTQRWMKY